MAKISYTPVTAEAVFEKVGVGRTGVRFKAALAALVDSKEIDCTETERNGNASPIRRYLRAR